MRSLNSDSSQIKPPPKPEYHYISEHYQSAVFGTHNDGNYIKTYIPDTPYHEPTTQNLKAVVYLHGFALGIPNIYEAHLEHLVKQGFFVFFPDYQKDNYDDNNQGPIENRIDLITTVMKSLRSSPKDWIKAAIASTSDAFKNVEVPNSPAKQKLYDSNVDVYLFGHSLGGLFALSWPHYLSKEQQKLNPLQVIAADPVPDSLSNLPNIVQVLLPKWLPFVKEPLSIEETRNSLVMPVAILHGKEDTIVSPYSWKEHFQTIASPNKKIYLSESDDHGEPNLSADHNQSTTNTRALLSKVLAQALGGDKSQADNLNWRYIWFALDKVIKGTVADELQFDMGKWSDGTPVKPIEIDEPWSECEKLEALFASLIEQS